MTIDDFLMNIAHHCKRVNDRQIKKKYDRFAYDFIRENILDPIQRREYQRMYMRYKR
tara:strand:+ start:5597 stop:5767 length:171 start_codon:yes stop_codon:yes gene_type:complete